MEVAHLLKERGLKVTAARVAVIDVLRKSGQAFSHAELEVVFTTFDRVTLYRILKDFEDAGIVHKIMDMQGVTRYALCGHSCPGEHHADEHVHFNCESCHKMFCLEKVQAPAVKMPLGFKATGRHTLIYGLCKNCGSA
jgi:Fur family transcriptional regulator, ferric uptake regulator